MRSPVEFHIAVMCTTSHHTIVPHDIYVTFLWKAAKRPHTKYPEGITALLGTFWFNQATAVQYVKQEVPIWILPQ